MTVPKLRFNEFDGEWKKIAVGNFSETVTSGSRDWAQYYSELGDKFIRMTNLVRDGINLDLSDLRFVKLPDNSNEGKRTNLQAGDILISITAELGKLGWIPQGLGTAYINQHTALVRMKNEMDSKFIAYELSTEKYNKKLNSLNDSGAKAGLNLSTIRNFELIVPFKKEQTKIASFLSAVDEKISQLTQKHALLSQYKQGMMQKLFSQQLRFKADDGCEFGAWEETTVGQTGKFIGGGTPSKENQKFWEGSIPWISSSDLIDASIFKINISRYISEEALSQSATKLIPANSILIVSRVGVGKVAITTNEICTSQDFTSLSLSSGKPIFFAYLIKSLTPYLLEMNQGTSIKGFVKDDLANLAVKIPCIEEQTKIANFLSTIDQKIDVVAQQIEQAKVWKKGLLQQMFV